MHACMQYIQYMQAKSGCCKFPKSVNLAGNLIEKVKIFYCFGDVLCTESGVKEAVAMRIRTG